MAEHKGRFLERWSRLKHETQDLPQEAEKEQQPGEAPALPPVDQLTPESDFTGFMHPKVQDALRRVALKKLFSDPHFNVPDPYEAYSGDWTVGEPISEEMLATLNQARTLLFDKDRTKEEPSTEDAPKIAAGDASAEHPTEPEQDEPGRKDA
jgi:hypothetical protein